MQYTLFYRIMGIDGSSRHLRPPGGFVVTEGQTNGSINRSIAINPHKLLEQDNFHEVSQARFRRCSGEL
jgi:hypothetical protein